MPAEEREKRHHHNFMHVTTHTSQEWAATFVSELNDTIIGAQLRTKQIPPPLPIKIAVDRFSQSKNRLLILGFKTTLTKPAEILGRRGGDQIRVMEPKLHPALKEPLRFLCDDQKTSVVVFSGSHRNVLDKNFDDYNLWLAAENGMFLRTANGDWVKTVPENQNMDWVDCVKHVFEYFTERTPRSHFELRETSLLWSYKYADAEFGRLQARDMLQLLWSGPISNAPVEVVQGSRSIEVRAVGVTKGAAIGRIIGEIYHNRDMTEPIDYVLCAGHFLTKDEDHFGFFEAELARITTPRSNDRTRSASPRSGGIWSRPNLKKRRSLSTLERRKRNRIHAHRHSISGELTKAEGSSVLDLKSENYFSCAVSWKRSSARYPLGTSEDVVTLLKELANSTTSSTS